MRLEIAPAGQGALLTWTNPAAVLEGALSVTGAWSEVSGAGSPYPVAATNAATFFRLRLTILESFDFRYVAPSFTTSIGDPSGCGCTSPESPNSLQAGGNAQDNAMGSVFLHTGELTQHALDLEIPGRGFNWRFERRYRSGMDYDGPLGHGWDFNHNRRLMVQTNGDVLCMDGLGRADRYRLNTNGGFDSPSGFYAHLRRNLDGSFDERGAHGTTNSYSATNTLGIARLSRVSDRNSNQMNFQYNGAGQLTNVVDTLARSIHYNYDTNGRVTSVVDFSGRAVQFVYDSNGDLASATAPAVTSTPNGNDFPSGKTTAYTYASGLGDARFNHNLLTVTAPNEGAVSGPPWLVAQYDTNSVSPNADRLLSLRVGGTNASSAGAGGTIYYTYASLGSAPSNDFATAIFQNTITNRAGNVTEYRFNQLGNIVRTIQFTRGLRAGDPAGYTNVMAYNSDGEIIARTNAELDSVQFTFDSSNPDRLQQGNRLQTARLPGPRGGDQAQIITSATYETNFNFAATSTDGRGNATIYAYDSRGNRTHTTNRDPAIVEDFAYNAYGQMTSHTLPENGSGHRRVDTMSYYVTGPQTGYLQTSVVDSGGFNLTTTYEYDSVGNAVRVIDPRGNDTLYTRNALNQVVRESARAVSTLSGSVRYTRDYFYDANNNVVRVDVQNRDDSGAVVAGNSAFTTTTSYDILNDVLNTSQEVDTNRNIVTAYSYDANQNRTFTRLGEATAGRQTNNVVQSVYDERDLPFKQIRAPGTAGQSTTQQDYDRNGNPVQTAQGTEDAGGHVTASAYDGYDRRTTTTDAMGNVITMRYDSNGNVVTNRTDGELTDGPGGAGNTNLTQAAYTYDAMDRRVRTDAAFFDTQSHANIGDGQATTLTIYAKNSQTIAIIDDNGHGRTNSYDTANRLSLVTDAKGNTVGYTYDPNGNAVATTEVDKSDLGNPDQSFTTTRTYDALDRPVSVSDNLTNTAQYRYDSRNNRTLVTDPRGNQTQYTYDGLNRLIRTSRDMNTNSVFDDAVDITTSQAYDDDSRVTSRTDDNTNTTRYAYDELSRLIATQMADGTVRQAGTGAVWNLGDSQPNLSGFVSGYDAHGNPLVTLDANGTRVDSAYDSLNRVVTNRVTRAAGVLGTTNEVYAYDGLSRVARATDDDSIVTRVYDSLSRVTAETNTFFSANASDRVVRALYDGVGNQAQLTYPGGRVIGRTFDELDRPSVVQQIAPSLTNIATYKYVGQSRPEQRDYGNGTSTLWQYDGITGVLNPAGDFGVKRVIRTTHTNVITGGLIDDRQYTWDRNANQNQMLDLLLPQTRNYTYDAINRLATSVFSPDNITNVYNLEGAGNRTTVVSNGVSGTYTESGTLPEPADLQVNQYTTTPYDTSRSYDRNGNLTNVIYASGIRRTFSYDFRNQLVQVSDSDTGTFGTYNYDALGRRINKIANGVATRFYCDGIEEIEERNAAGTVLATYVYSKGVASRLQMQRSGANYFYHEDHLNSVAKVTDTSGLTVGANRRDDYGQEFQTPFSLLSQSPNQTASKVSNSPSSVYAAENFTLSLASTLSSAVFWGSDSNVPPNSPPADSFSGAILADSAGSPGAPITTFTVSSNRLTRTLTGLAVGGRTEYRYTVQFASPISLAAGTYWIVIYNNVSTTTAWLWEQSPAGDNKIAVSTSSPLSGYTTTPGNMAVQLMATTNGTGNPYGFTGQRFDPETAWYFCHARYLDSGAGRFLTRDPIGGWCDAVNLGNPLSYVGNNPLSRSDPLGLMAKITCITIFGGSLVPGIGLGISIAMICWDNHGNVAFVPVSLTARLGLEAGCGVQVTEVHADTLEDWLNGNQIDVNVSIGPVSVGGEGEVHGAGMGEHVGLGLGGGGSAGYNFYTSWLFIAGGPSCSGPVTTPPQPPPPEIHACCCRKPTKGKKGWYFDDLGSYEATGTADYDCMEFCKKNHGPAYVGLRGPCPGSIEEQRRILDSLNKAPKPN